jgi:hypothetical protein
MPLLVACLLSSTTQASSTSAYAARSGGGGVITFTGSITQRTSVPVMTAVPAQVDPSTKTTVEFVSEAQPRLASDLLDYYAQYAKPGAKLVSVDYQ